MLMTLARLAKNGFNQRRLTEEDFHRICDREHIHFTEDDVDTSFYWSVMGKRFITVPKHLKGHQREFAMFHELGHHFLHAKDVQALFHGVEDGPREAEADVFAAIALIPYPDVIANRLPEGGSEACRRLISGRLKLFQLHDL